MFHQAIIDALEKAQIVPQRRVKNDLKVSTQTNKSGYESETESSEAKGDQATTAILAAQFDHAERQHMQILEH